MYLGVDVGGTKTLLAVFDNKGVVLEQVRFETPKIYQNFLHELEEHLSELSHQTFNAVAVGIPGIVDRRKGKGVDFGNLPWKNVPIDQDLEKLLHYPVAIENDAKLGGLSEALLVHEQYDKALYVTIGTGIGIALIAGGEITTELSDTGGKSLLIEHEGKMQPWESFASGKAIMKRYGKRASDIDVEDTTIWKAIARNLAVGLIDLIALTEPDVIILGGGVATNYHKFIDFLTNDLKRYEAPMITIPPIEQAKRPEEAVVYGCYEIARKLHAGIAQAA